MKIKTALILCAGYGKRLNPLTLTTPKPLLKINQITLLENCINLNSIIRHKKNSSKYFLFRRKNQKLYRRKKI